MKRHNFFGVICSVTMAVTIAGCTPTISTRGNLVDVDLVEQIEVGQSRRQQVNDLLGPPTSTGTFDQNVWYYIGERTQQVAFYRPEVTERRILAIAFDSAGQVIGYELLALEDGQQVAFVDRTTPTAGRSLGLLEQLLGNLGAGNLGRAN